MKLPEQTMPGQAGATQPSQNSIPDKGRCRAFELDVLRGLALLMMVLHHFIFDLRYILNLDVFAFQDTQWFVLILRPFFVNVFILVSGICCTFSRNNTKRGLRLLAVALALTATTVVFSALAPVNFYIIFNVIHILAIGILLYAGLTWIERRKNRSLPFIDAALLLIAGVVFWMPRVLTLWPFAVSYWTIPLGLLPQGLFQMDDYLPLFPWLGYFLLGAEIGRIVYPFRQSAFRQPPAWLLAAVKPLEFLGRHSLLVYVLHQPILLSVLFALRALGLI